MSNTTEHPRKRSTYGPASFWVGLLGIIVANAALNRAPAELVSMHMILIAAGVVSSSFLAGALALRALAKHESSRGYAYFGMYFSLAGVLYVIRELLVSC
jgi:hypothetical protein